MMWVCRAGSNALYLNYFLDNLRIALPWEGYRIDLSELRTRDEFKQVVSMEKGEISSVSISNWGAQLYSLCCEMKIGDLVLIPGKQSHEYSLAIVVGEYMYLEKEQFCHVRDIKIINEHIPSSIFTQTIRYSLGAVRTLFKVKHESEILEILENKMIDEKF